MGNGGRWCVLDVSYERILLSGVSLPLCLWEMNVMRWGLSNPHFKGKGWGVVYLESCLNVRSLSRVLIWEKNLNGLGESVRVFREKGVIESVSWETLDLWFKCKKATNGEVAKKSVRAWIGSLKQVKRLRGNNDCGSEREAIPSL